MILIHTALLCEAMPIIERFKLTKTSPNIYKNDEIIVAISGIGKRNTSKCLEQIFSTCKASKAINIGIAGCSKKSIKIGELFCTNANILDIKRASLTTVTKPTKDIDTTLVDMEASAFVFTCKEYEVEHYVLKVVSDYLDSQIPKKSYVSSLIKESLNQWIELI